MDRSRLTASVDGSARLCDAHTGAPVGPPMRQQGSIFGVAFTADSKTAVTSGLDGTIRFWDAHTGGLKRPPIGVRGHVHSLAVSPDSKTILAGGDRIAWFCDVESGRVRGEPLEHKSEVSVVAFSPTGSQAMTYSDEGVVRLWEVATGRPVGPPRTVGASICKAFSPDETMLLAGRADGTARLWDVATGHPLGPPLMHRSEVVSVAFRGDGRMVATGDDQAAHLWDAPEEVAGDPARLLSGLRSSPTNNSTQRETPSA